MTQIRNNVRAIMDDHRQRIEETFKLITYELNCLQIERYCQSHAPKNRPYRDRKLSVILLSFNRYEDTRTALKYLYRNTSIPFELVVLDNGSTKETVEKLKRELSRYRARNKEITLVLEKNNLGAAKGKFKAAQQAKGDYLMFIDNDMRVMPFYLDNLMERLDSDEKLVAVCAKVVFPDKKIQFTGGNFRIDDTIITHGLNDSGKYFADPDTLGVGGCCDWVPGGATLWKKTLYFKFPIDNHMDGSYEDNEVSLRINRAGYRVGYSLRSICVHYHYTFKPQSFLKTEKTYLDDRYHLEKLKTGLVRYYETHKLIFVFGSMEGTWQFVPNPSKESILTFIKSSLKTRRK